MGLPDKNGLVRYVVDGKAIRLPKKTKAEQAAHKKIRDKLWVKNNQDKVRANTKRFHDHKEKLIEEQGEL